MRIGHSMGTLSNTGGTGGTGGTGDAGDTGGTGKAGGAGDIASGIQAAIKDMPAAEATMFKALVAAMDPSALAPNGKMTDESAKTLTNLAAVVSKITAMSVSGDTMNFLARVMIQQQGQQRHEAVQDRQNMRQLAMGELMAAAGELNKQAETIDKAALTTLIMSCVGAGLSIAGAATSIGTAAKGMKVLNAGEKGAETMAGMWGKIGDGASGVAGGMGKTLEAGGSYVSAEAQAETKRSEASAKFAEAAAQNLEGQAEVKKGVQDGLDEMVKQIINTVKELQDAKAERMHAFTRV